MKRRVRVAYWLFERSRLARYLFVWAVWPLAFLGDVLHDVHPRVGLRRGLDWARDGRLPATIPTAGEPAVVRRRETE